MKYTRPPYLSPDIPTGKYRQLFSSTEALVPQPPLPITPVENFRRVAARSKPLWVPNTPVDIQTLITRGPLFGEQSGVTRMKDLVTGSRYVDWFGVDWTWEATAGGPMTTPGIHLLDDITDWEKGVKFPDIDNIDWSSQVEDFMAVCYDPKRVMNCNIGAGVTERLVAILGGYTESMLALAMEPEACRDFMDAFADFTIRYIDKLFSFFPVNMITMHDDWGTERDTFFSEKMMEELVYEPTKRIVSHVKSKGGLFELHSCGNVTRFIPYMVEMGVDFMQIQRRAVNIPEIKVKYGGKIGIDTGIEGIEHGSGKSPEHDDYIRKIRNTVELYGKGGGFITNIFPSHDPATTWDAILELFYYSREFYDKERGE